MKFNIAPAQFRPVTITLETRDDFDKLQAIVDQVAENRINHARPTIDAARELAVVLRSLDKEQP